MPGALLWYAAFRWDKGWRGAVGLGEVRSLKCDCFVGRDACWEGGLAQRGEGLVWRGVNGGVA